jgi:hypothetical protein
VPLNLKRTLASYEKLKSKVSFVKLLEDLIRLQEKTENGYEVTKISGAGLVTYTEVDLKTSASITQKLLEYSLELERRVDAIEETDPSKPETFNITLTQAIPPKRG